MYPPGTRVVKVWSLANKPNPPIGTIGTVVAHTIPPRYGDLVVACDSLRSRSLTGLWDCSSSNWSPIDPDAEEWQSEEQKELEQVCLRWVSFIT